MGPTILSFRVKYDFYRTTGTQPDVLQDVLNSSRSQRPKKVAEIAAVLH